MSLKSYVLLMSIGTLLCWLAWGFVLLYLAPAEAGLSGLLFFYSSLFLAIVGSFSVLGLLIRLRVLKEDEIVFRHVRRAFRQSVLISGFLILILILQSQHLLAWWNLIILLSLFFFLEGVMFTGRKFNNRDYVR